MHCGIGGIDKLARQEGARCFGGQLLRLGDGAGHPLGPLGQHQLRPVGAQQVAALDAHGLRHGKNHPVALGGCHGGQADAGITACGLDDNRARSQQAPGLRVLNHGLGNPILGATRRVKALQLDQQGRFELLGLFHAGQLQQGGAADQIGHFGIHTGHHQRLHIFI